MSLWVVRHARPLVAEGTCYGRLDVPADPHDTVRAATALAEVLPERARVVYSPLQRCELLAQTLCGLRPDLATNCVPDARLMEMDFGTHEGQAWASIPHAQMQAWTDDFAHHPFGGGESVEQFMQRIAAAWDDYQQHSQHAAGLDTVWISHAGVARAVQLLSHGHRQVLQAKNWPQEGPAFGEWCRY